MAKKRRFPLATLLGLRKRAEDTAKAELGRCSGEVAARDAEMKKRYDELTSTVAAPTSTPTSFRAAICAQNSLRTLLLEAQAAKEVAEERRDVARVEWQQAHAKRQAISRLEEKHNDAVKREEAKAEQQRVDDVVNARYTKDEPLDSTDAATSPQPGPIRPAPEHLEP